MNNRLAEIFKNNYGDIFAVIYNKTKNKDEKFYYLMLAGMCNLGYCNSKNPFGTRDPDPELGFQQKNYDLQFRMYQINHIKYKTIPSDIKAQLKKRGRVKHKTHGLYNGREMNWKQQGISNMENKIFIPKVLTPHEEGLKVKVKEERLMKGRYLECDEISNKYQEGWSCHLYDAPQLIYYNPDKYNDKPILKDFFYTTYPFDPSWSPPTI